MSQSAWIEARNLRCERDDRCLFHNLSFTLNGGEILQVAGPNGAGKSTLLRILIGLSAGYEGGLSWMGQDMGAGRYDFLANTLYLGHQPGVKGAMTPEENLIWWQSRFSKAERESVYAALEQVGLRGYEDIPSYHLSAGQQRRVALARLYLQPPKLWILDEPFTAIDKVGVARLEQTIVEHAERGGAVILTTHHELPQSVPVRTLTLGGAQ